MHRGWQAFGLIVPPPPPAPMSNKPSTIPCGESNLSRGEMATGEQSPPLLENSNTWLAPLFGFSVPLSVPPSVPPQTGPPSAESRVATSPSEWPLLNLRSPTAAAAVVDSSEVSLLPPPRQLALALRLPNEDLFPPSIALLLRCLPSLATKTHAAWHKYSVRYRKPPRRYSRLTCFLFAVTDEIFRVLV